MPMQLLPFRRPLTCEHNARRYMTRENWAVARPMRLPRRSSSTQLGRDCRFQSHRGYLSIITSARSKGPSVPMLALQIRDGIKSVAQWGDCPETEWPYDFSQFAVQPPQSCYDDASKHLALVYESVIRI